MNIYENVWKLLQCTITDTEMSCFFFEFSQSHFDFDQDFDRFTNKYHTIPSGNLT